MGRSLQNTYTKNDEMYTPPILVEPILSYIPRRSVIWCPFDTEDSEFVKILQANGHKVLYSHIWDGRDFFKYEPDEYYSHIISNPPFSRKLEVMDRLFELGKPFAMLMNLMTLNYQVVGEFFNSRNKQLQLLIPDKKVSFNGNTSSFNTAYFCHNMLPKDVVFCHLEHNNSGKNFTRSSMYQKEVSAS